ncbi:hypothetical protein SFRURICE_012069 [Spodoptera frugiperda]|nr:hypothetical protein SFRURICE_012069 [Spodoptera frugiperda]
MHDVNLKANMLSVMMAMMSSPKSVSYCVSWVTSAKTAEELQAVPISLPLNDVATSRGHDRTPTDRHRGFPERDREGSREHRRERDRDRERERDPFDFDDSRPVRKSSSAHRVTETSISTDKRRFFCREWAFQKIAHCLEQRPVTRAVSHTESSLRPGEFVRSLAMQILSHSSRRPRADNSDLSPRDPDTPHSHRRNSEEERLISRFRELGDDGEESSKPLLADSEDQRTDEEDGGCSSRARACPSPPAVGPPTDLSADPHADAPLSTLDDVMKPTNPFVTEEKDDLRLYENHENLFLRNISQRQSKELRNSRLLRQSSEPLSEKKTSLLQKSLSTEQKNDSSGEDRKVENSPPKSRIPVANFRYPNKSDLRSAENSPSKKPERPSTPKEELPEYQNVLKPEVEVQEGEKKREEDVPPPIPSLPISPRTLIANAYYDKLLAEPEIQQALLPQNLEKNPDECFKKALLFPLLEIDPPKQCLFLLVDAIDEGITGVARLLARHQHLFPHWLLLVCTARKHCRNLTRMFTGFRKITLDELQRAHVSADVQRYVLARLDTEPRLRARVSSDSTAAAAAAAACLYFVKCQPYNNTIHIVFARQVLDGVADGFIALREIREIPGTLNGLYLWLAQRLFHGRRFTKVIYVFCTYIEQHSATHDAAIVALLLATRVLSLPTAPVLNEARLATSKLTINDWCRNIQFP